MTSATKFTTFVDALSKASINLNTAAFKVALFTSAPSTSTSLYSSLTGEVSSGNGYTTGGIAVSSGSGQATDSTGTESIASLTSITWTASSSGFSFRYAVLYDSTSGVNVEFWDNGSTITLSGANGDQFVLTQTGSVLLTLA